MRQFRKIATLGVVLLGLVVFAARADSRVGATLIPANQVVTRVSAPAAAPATTMVAATPTTVTTPSIPSTPDPSSRAPDLPVVTPQAMRGMAVVKPSNPAAALGTPTYTEQELRAVVMTAGYWPSEFKPTGMVTVASLELLSRPQVAARVGALPPMPNDLFYLVKLSGGFARPAPDPGGSGAASQPVVSANLYLLFDARSGNLMMKYQPAGEKDK